MQGIPDGFTVDGLRYENKEVWLTREILSFVVHLCGVIILGLQLWFNCMLSSFLKWIRSCRLAIFGSLFELIISFGEIKMNNTFNYWILKWRSVHIMSSYLMTNIKLAFYFIFIFSYFWGFGVLGLNTKMNKLKKSILSKICINGP